ncbi:hypothetical protein R3P38DRAFT_1886095 [Favolaschia claudopus]|uniref:Secreted protein n=1 Tax=Favolaschia claudopus TaxID=2862362 RepID=A0AAW0DAF1_9AGAR
MGGCRLLDVCALSLLVSQSGLIPPGSFCTGSARSRWASRYLVCEKHRSQLCLLFSHRLTIYCLLHLHIRWPYTMRGAFRPSSYCQSHPAS